MVSGIRATALCVVALLSLIVSTADAQVSDTFDLKKVRGVKSVKANFSVKLTPSTAKAGEEVTLEIAATVPEGFHIYSMTQKQPAAQPTLVKVARANGLEVVDAKFTADKEPEVTPSGLDDLEEYRGTVTWTKKYRIRPDADLAEVLIDGKIIYSICTDVTKDAVGGGCFNGEEPFEVKLAQAAPEPGPMPEQGLPPGDTPDSLPPVPGDNAPREAPQAAPGQNAAVEHRVKGALWATWKASLSPGTAAPGDIVTLTLEADIADGRHLYSANQQPSADGTGPIPMAVRFDVGQLEPNTAAFIGPKPKEHPSEGFTGLIELHHEGKVRWTRKFEVPKDAKPGDVPILGVVSYQICQQSCVAGAVRFDGILSVADKTIAEPAILQGGMIRVPEADEILQNSPDPVQDGGPPNLTVPPKGTSPSGAEDPRKQGFVPFLLTAVISGFLALLTPCVFPMVPITVAVFQKQAERQHTNPVLMALVYSLSIIATFTGLGLLMSMAFGGGALTLVANNPWLNVGIGLLLAFFACNMLGMYDIVMPASIINLSASQQTRGGYAGVVFMGLTFTLTSFTCTFAFVGGLLALAAAGEWLWPLFGLLAFSASFALPFFFLALFPTALKQLPKSGGWMNAIKVVMGLLELGATFKFLSVADIMWNGRPTWFDFEFVMTAWMVLALVAGVYLLGLFRTPHDTPVEHIGVPRLLFATVFLGLGAYLAVGMFSPKKVDGLVWDNIVAFAPPELGEVANDAEIGPTQTHDGFTYALDPDKALQAAIRQGKPLFIDITGVNCVNCRKMEIGPLSKPEVKSRFKDFVLVRMYADRVPSIGDPPEERRIFKRNVELQEKWVKDQTMPTYVVVNPTPDAYSTQDSILSLFIGHNENTSAFTSFLDKGLSEWKLASGKPAQVVHDTTDPELGPVLWRDGVKLALDADRALKVAVRTNRPLFVEFTGINSMNCRLMEQRVVEHPQIAGRLKEAVRVIAFVDRLPAGDPQEQRRLQKRNTDLMDRWLRDVSLPYYVVVRPTEDALRNRESILSSFAGCDPSIDKFAAFIDEGLSQCKPDATDAAQVADKS